MARSRAEKLIRQINDRIDQIAKEYGMESDIFQILTKHTRGGDAPEMATSKAGTPHVRSTKENRGDLQMLERIREDLSTKSEIKKQSSAAGVSEAIFAKEYERAAANMESRLQEIYGRYGTRTDEMPKDLREQIEILHRDFNTKAELVKAFRVLDKYYDAEE